MPFLKQTFMWIFFLIAMYIGGSSTQSSSNMLQGFGFVSIVMAFICLYIIFKLMWRARGTITTLLVLGAVVIYSSYSVGLFNGKTLSSIMTGAPSAKPEIKLSEEQKQQMQQDAESLDMQLFGESYNTEVQERTTQIQQPVEDDTPGLGDKLKKTMFGQAEENKQEINTNLDINPFDYPAIRGFARVITGSVLRINGLNVKMYGIDAPDISQTCANHFGAAYYCGREARTWLQNWLNNREVTCHILGDVENGWATGTCFVDDNKYDVAAVTVNSGWAVAYTKNTNVYVEYENQARVNRRGLWAGTFYKPWDWRKIQNRKVEIKIKRTTPSSPSSEKSGGFDFWGLF